MKKINVLIIEQDPAETRAIEKMLSIGENSDCRPCSVTSTVSPDKISAECSYDIILLDISHDSGAAADMFRSFYRRDPFTPVVLLCREEQKSMALNLLGEGAQDYVCKDTDDLCHSIRKALQSALERNRMRKQLRNQIAEQQQVEEALRKNREQLSFLLSNLPGMVYRCQKDSQWTMLFVSDGCMALTGYLPEDLIHNQRISFNELIREEYRESIREKWDQVLADKSPFEEEYPITDASGKIRWVWERGQGIFDPEGTLLYLEGYIEDITGWKEAARALVQEQYLNEMLIENLPDHIYFKDLQSRFIRNNRSHARAFGIDDPKQMTGKSDFDFFVKEFAQKAYEDEQQIIRTGISISKEEQAIQQDQSKRWYLATKMPLRDKESRIVGTFGISRDITALKELNEALLLAKEKAEENDQLKSAFLANISHEIRTPMNGILGFTELLKDPEISKEDHDMYLRIIEQSGYRMLSIINNIVDISKIEAGQMELHIDKREVNPLLQDLRLFFLPGTREKGLELFCHCGLPDELSVLETDHTKLTQTLTNLIKNAIKFTSSGSIDFGYERKGKFLEFFVKDTGEGIEKEQIPVIFERFRQGSFSLTRNYEGAGLGLSISKAYIEMLGGKVRVESERGKGSVFFFTLPYCPSAAPEAGPTSKPSGVRYDQALHILITEDDENSMMFLRTILQNEKIHLFCASNGKEALDLVRAHPEIRIVLMDLKMPVMDGFEATRQIKAFRPSLPVIAQTAYAFSNDREKAREAGCDDLITKPVKKETLFSMIKKYSRS